MNSRHAVTAIVLVWTLISAPAVRLSAQENGRSDDAALRITEAIAGVHEKVAPTIERLENVGELVSSMTRIVRSLNLPAPDQKALVDALAGIRSAQQVRGLSRELYRELALADDRLRTELLNPATTDMRKLSDDLHHSVWYAVAGEHRQRIRATTELLQLMQSVDDALSELESRVSTDRRTEHARLMIPHSRRLDPGNEIFLAFDDYGREIARLTERLRVHREVAKLTQGAMDDLDTFQNAIGLGNAKEKLEEAKGKVEHPDADPRLRTVIDVALDRVNGALLSPSSHDMKMLREALHHEMVHQVEVVSLSDTIEVQKQLAFLMKETAKTAQAASGLAESVAAASAREVPALLDHAKPEPAGAGY